MELFFALIGLHCVAVVVATLCVFNREARLHAPAVVFLLLDAVGFVLSGNLDFSASSTLRFVWMFTGPVYLPLLILFDAFPAAPLLALLALVVAIGVTVLIWRTLWRQGVRTRMVAAGLGGFLGAILALEVSVEIVMRADAARIPDSCGFWRQSTLTMISRGSSSDGSRHGGLADGHTNYTWSFRHGGWTPRFTCPPAGALSCSCED